MPVGYIDFYTFGGIGNILGIYVDEKRRLTNIGSELLKHALKILKNLGCHRAKAIVYSYNKLSLEFFKANLFTEAAKFPDDEFHRDVVIMATPL